MKLYLQFGHGMMDHCRHFVSQWAGGTVVLSPRDLSPQQLQRLSADINSRTGGAVLVDPQFYLPHSDHHRLCSHDFWPASYDTGGFWSGSALAELLDKLVTLNHTLKSEALILPGLLAAQVDNIWLSVQEATLQAAQQRVSAVPLLMTIALSAEATHDQNQIGQLLDASRKWNPAGYYIVCEHPRGNYLVDDPVWLANVVDLAAGLRLRGKRVILGYCNHQMLIAAVAKVDAICSGTWMNVRSFPPEKFQSAEDEEGPRRAIWYYCPQGLSEYKLSFLDVAHTQGLLSLLAPPDQLSTYAGHLFQGDQPSTIGLHEGTAFRHYLACLHQQVLAAEQATFDETVAAHEQLLDDAEQLLNTLSAARVRGQGRDFRDIIEVNRAALTIINTTRAPVLRHKWSVI